MTTTAGDEFRYNNPGMSSWSDRHGVALYGWLQLLVFPLAVYLLSREGHTSVEIAGGIASLAVMAGSVGGLAGHEFIHRRERLLRSLGIAIYGWRI